MDICDLKKETLEVIHDDTTYTETFFKIGTVTGVADEDHEVWTSGGNFSEGQYITLPALKSIYRSTVDNNTGNFPPASKDLETESKKWQFYGYINSARLFGVDEAIGSKTTGTDIKIVVDFSRANTFALVNTDFDSINIKQIDNSNDSVINGNEVNINGVYVAAKKWSDWFYGDLKKRRKIINIDFSWHPNCRLEVQFTGAVSIETLGFGRKQDLFLTLYGTRLDFQSESIVEVNSVTQFRKVVRYGRTRVLVAKVLYSTDNFDSIAQAVDEIMDKYILFIPTTQDKFSELLNIGYIEKGSLVLENSTMNETDITIVGTIQYD